MAKTRVLLVDDEENLGRLMKLSLEASGDFDVLFVSDGSKALEAARSFKPEVMILDVVMPGTDGGQIILNVRDDPEMKNIPVFFLTASVAMGSADSNPTLFGCPCISKPAPIDEVVDLIEQCLRPKGE